MAITNENYGRIYAQETNLINRYSTEKRFPDESHLGEKNVSRR